MDLQALLDASECFHRCVVNPDGIELTARLGAHLHDCSTWAAIISGVTGRPAAFVHNDVRRSAFNLSRDAALDILERERASIAEEIGRLSERISKRSARLMQMRDVMRQIGGEE